MKLIILILSLVFAQTVPSLALGDKSLLPSSPDAMTGTVRALNQVRPEGIEEDLKEEKVEEEQEILGTQDVQERQYQVDQRREKRQEEVERYRFDEPEHK